MTHLVPSGQKVTKSFVAVYQENRWATEFGSPTGHLGNGISLKHFRSFYVFTNVNRTCCLATNRTKVMWNVEKLPPVVEDLRTHTPEHLAELRVLLKAGLVGRPDMRWP